MCRRFSAGTRTLLKRMRACQVPRIVHLDRLRLKMSTPSMSGVTIRAVTRSDSLPVFGSTTFCLPITVKRPDRAPEVAHFFSPETMVNEPSSFFTKRVSCPPASQPTLGSERQKAESVSVAIRGRNRRFCSSVPKRFRAPQPMDWWAETITAVEPQVSPIRESTRL